MIDGTELGDCETSYQLSPGTYLLVLELPNDYFLSITLVAVANGEPRITSRLSQPNCSPGANAGIRLVDSGLLSFTTKNARAALRVATPNFTTVAVTFTCQTSASVARLRQIGIARLQIRSVPTGARVFVRGIDMGTTDNTFNIPIRSPEQQRLLIRMRMAGRATCLRTIELLDHDFSAEVSCQLARR